MPERQRELRNEWDHRVREIIRRRVEREQPRASGPDDYDAESYRINAAIDDEVYRRFDRLMQMEVPTNAELRAMQARGELPSDEELARTYP